MWLLSHCVIASAHTLGAIWGSMMCGFLMSIFGQRRAILIAAPVTLASWLSIWLAPFFSVMVTARLAFHFEFAILSHRNSLDIRFMLKSHCGILKSTRYFHSSIHKPTRITIHLETIVDLIKFDNLVTPWYRMSAIILLSFNKVIKASSLPTALISTTMWDCKHRTPETKMLL